MNTYVHVHKHGAGPRFNDTALRERGKYARALGKAFNGERDIYKVLGYPDHLNFQDFYAMYCRHDIAGRIVELPATSTWRKKIQVIEGTAIEDREDTEFEKQFKILARRTKLWHFMERVDILSGIGRFGTLMMGFPGKLDSQVRTLKGVEDLYFLSPFSEGSSEVTGRDVNLSSRRFGLPSMYGVDVLDELESLTGVNLKSSKSSRKEKVHHSRMIHVTEGLGESEVYGMPRLQRVYNLLLDLTKSIGGSAEAMWQIADRGMYISIDADAELDKEDEKKLSQEVEEYMNRESRWIKGRGLDVKTLGGENVDPRGLYGPIMALITGTTGIPSRILAGSDRGQLASQQDKRNFLEYLSERQTWHIEPNILRPFIDRMIEFRVLPEPANGEYTIKWPDLLAIGEDLRSLVASRVAQAVEKFAKARKDYAAEEVITVSEFRDTFLGLSARVPEPSKPIPAPDDPEDGNDDDENDDGNGGGDNAGNNGQ